MGRKDMQGTTKTAHDSHSAGHLDDSRRHSVFHFFTCLSRRLSLKEKPKKETLKKILSNLQVASPKGIFEPGCPFGLFHPIHSFANTAF